MPQDEQSQLSKLFNRPDQQPFGQQEVPQQQEEELPEDLKNRHIRRLEAKLQAERESAIAREARITALSEAQKFREDKTVTGWEEKARRIYGTDKPENAAASELLIESIREATQSAKREALEETRRDYTQRQEEEEKEVQTVHDYIEQIEDTYGIDLTSTDAAKERQQQFRDLWFRLSPKDSRGEVTDYADPFEVYEIFKESQGANRARQFASRGMVRSQPITTTVQEDATVKYLKEHGIIEPF